MALKIKNDRANIKPEFIEAIRKMYDARLKIILDKRKMLPEQQRTFYDKDNLLAISRLLDIHKKPEAFDRELLEFRTLPYSVFTVYEDFLCALTKPIVITGGGRTWDAGPYAVYVATNVVEGLNSDRSYQKKLHFVPVEFPTTAYRHPHHVSMGDNTHPTKMQASTCWGGYGSIVVDIISSGDYVDLFRTIASYLSRYDQHSPLTSISNVKNAKLRN